MKRTAIHQFKKRRLQFCGIKKVGVTYIAPINKDSKETIRKTWMGTVEKLGHPNKYNRFNNMEKCQWAVRHPLEEEYHDKEWGVPVHDDQTLFEFLTLEGAQAGLSWTTVLVKRENYRKALDGFDPEIIANYDQTKLDDLLLNKGIIRNKLKVKSLVTNAKAFMEVQKEFGSFSKFIWQFVDSKPIQNAWEKMGDVPATTPVSDAMSKALKKKGFKFVGPTICYAFMQAVGMVNDHLTSCPRYEEVKEI
mmetsp:Transcript_19404/g.35255  ORF Transcript_19404/g.35255 Transcript_19404/m.35255 type:complete len:249 (+) Transcript_19404:176-922(+)